MKKIRIAIDIDEILRAKWLQFDRYYVEEFGEEGVPKEIPYTHDFFRDYEWKDRVEKEKYLRNPDEIPDTINPLDYQTDGNDEAPADYVLFETEKEKQIKAEEEFNRFMYENYLLEIHGTAPVMYKGIEQHFDRFLLKYNHFVDFTIISKENWFSTPPTLFFLSKMMCRVKKYVFVDTFKDYWKRGHDLIITANPDVITVKPKTKKHIKIDRPYNKDVDSGEIKDILQINDLYNNTEFEKLVKYKNKKENGK